MDAYGAFVMLVFFGAFVVCVGSWILHALARLQARRGGVWG